VLYPDGERGAWLRRLVRAPRGTAIPEALGRHSLPIYLVHQPVLIVLTAMILALTGTSFEWP
jgi:peptidoglycan/LPS O-acetylase OafA/YrhL